MDKIDKTNEEWKKELDSETYHVTREGGTEAPFTGKYLHETKEGTYNCAVCGNPLFLSTSKFDSHNLGLAGWPSFDEALPGAVEFKKDPSYGMERTEVICARCKSHLGHVFNDPEAKTGKHYCTNSCALNLKEK